jgi:hypothetical protein
MSGSPVPQIQPDDFSAQWSGYLFSPTTGSYGLTLMSDDGARLRLNGREIINSWNVANLWTSRAEVTLLAGKWYPIQVDYKEMKGNAKIMLAWRLPGSFDETVITSNYFAQSTLAVDLYDVNGDGKVTPSDATLALQFALGKKTPSPEERRRADVIPKGNPDGKVDVRDATSILRYAVGLTS